MVHSSKYLTRLGQTTRIGISGTGYIAQGLYKSLQTFTDIKVVSVLTRRHVDTCTEFPGILTDSIDELVDSSDLIVECSGSVLHAASVVEAAFNKRLPVVTMNAEFQVTLGSHFVGRGMLTEAEGDQPGCLAAMKESAEMMGFKPLVYGNVKGFLNLNPSREEMLHWASVQGLRLDKVVAFTDGTKMQIEQTLVANGLGATIAVPGMLGPQEHEVEIGAWKLAAHAWSDKPLSDYVVCRGAKSHVFIVATHDGSQELPLKNFKMGNGPYYLLDRTRHLCHLEVPKTIKRVLEGGPALLTNGTYPEVGVAAIAKRDLPRGTSITAAIGGFDVRGSCVRYATSPSHVSLGLLDGACLNRDIERGTMIRQGDVELGKAANQWQQIISARILKSAA